MNMQTLAERFCAASLPVTVCSDLCATKQGPGRTGTNLMTVAEAKIFLQRILDGPGSNYMGHLDDEEILAEAKARGLI